MNWQTCVEHAAALIDKCGWIQGKEGDPVEGFCTIGAIALVCRGDATLFENSCRAIARRLGADGGGRGPGDDVKNAVARWNDSASSKEQVVTFLVGVARSPTSVPCECASCSEFSKGTALGTLGSPFVNMPAPNHFDERVIRRETFRQMEEMLAAKPLDVGFPFGTMTFGPERKPISTKKARKELVPA